MEPPPPPAPPVEPPPTERGLRCPNCGAPHDRYQEYCLECGQRLVPLYAGGGRREIWTRESPVWFWAAMAALFLVALVAAAIVAYAATREEEPRRVVAPATATTQPVPELTETAPVTLPPTTTIEPLTETDVTIPTLPTTLETETVAPTQPVPPPGTTGDIISWPGNQDGYTIVLASVETSRGRAPAEQRANEAINAGLSEVGILDSSNFLSLNPGYYVVFTGVYDALAGAQADLANIRNAGFPLAYVREITP